MAKTLKNFGLLYLLLLFVGACLGAIHVMNEPDVYTANPLRWGSDVWAIFALSTAAYFFFATCISYMRNEN